jgi:hypothetical protein
MSKHKNSKSLVKKMTYPEVEHYCDEHPDWKIPTMTEAQNINIDECDHAEFWICDRVCGRNLVYSKLIHCMRDAHPMFMNHVVLVRKENK